MVSRMHISLAPMEGLVDPLLRDVWTSWGGYDQCTTEFIRVTHLLLPEHVFHRECPELLQGGKTRAGIPVVVQLLGGDPNCLAENAHRAAELGAPGIDLNFGCPAPTVNRHDGGAVLLQYPDRIHSIVAAVRAQVPNRIPVTAKLRLGFENTDLCLQNVEAAASAGAETLTIHCRTKKDFYRPPAFWEWIPKIRDHLASQKLHPKICANGEIWSREDFEKCHSVVQADHYMLGRGAVADPFLAEKIKNSAAQYDWEDIETLMPKYFEICLQRESSKYAVTRTKQWLRLLAQRWPQAQSHFEKIKSLSHPEEIWACWQNKNHYDPQHEFLALN